MQDKIISAFVALMVLWFVTVVTGFIGAAFPNTIAGAMFNFIMGL